MKKPQFVENQTYHIYNRGVEKREIFTDDKDRFRFIHDLFEFNDENAVSNVSYYFNTNTKSMEVEPQYLNRERKPRKLLIEILVFTLMLNHFHLILRQKRKDGIVKFMQKLGTGYTMYFNKKYERVGSLFQGRFKAVLVNQESHFIHLPFYIHTNPLDLKIYRGSTSIDWQRQMRFLENYRWSSFLDYIGKKNFPSVTCRRFFLEFFGGEKEYKKETERWLKEKDKNLEEIKTLVLENY